MQVQFVEETKVIIFDAASQTLLLSRFMFIGSWVDSWDCKKNLMNTEYSQGLERNMHFSEERSWSPLPPHPLYTCQYFQHFLLKGNQSIFQDLGSLILFPGIFTDIMSWTNVKWFSRSCFHFCHQTSKHFFTQMSAFELTLEHACV